MKFEEGMGKYRNFNKLCDLLDEKLGSSYDLVTKEGLSPYIGPKILEEVEYVQIAS